MRSVTGSGNRRFADERGAAPPDAKALDEMARRAWRERGIVILWPDRIRDDWDRQHLLNLANSFYGPRHGASGSK